MRAAATEPLAVLQADFRRTSTNAMPIAGAVAWGALGLAALRLSPVAIGTGALYIMCAILPLAFLVERLRGRNLFSGATGNPLERLFFLSVAWVALTIPLVLIGARGADNPTLVVLGMAVLAGLIWIPYGWAADDPAGLQHAVGRSVLCYAAYALVAAPWTASAICAAVVLSYGVTLARMRPVSA